MTPAHRLFVGTIGEGVFRSLDGGKTFQRTCEGMFVECDVRALVVHPNEASTLYLGSEQGVFVTTDGADHWSRLPAPVDGLQIWSLYVSPLQPGLIVAGTCPSDIYRSTDGGKTWAEGRTDMLHDCPRIMHTRVTCIAGDPENADRLWAGVEIDGVHRSEDAGRTWRPMGDGLSSRDIHSLAVVPGQGSARHLLAATNNDLNHSSNGGESWRPQNIGKALPWSYCRALAQIPGRPNELLLGNGDGPPGSVGVVGRSADGGRSWQVTQMPDRANSTLWNFAVHAADSALVYAASVSGQLYRSTDAGLSWEKLPREFGEVRALAWAPA
jgi:photosystem II stability/assembly factor-like uncharacterized protein